LYIFLNGTFIEILIESIFMNKTFLTLLVGIGIGILLAPGKGSDTWKKLVDGFDEYKDKLSKEGSDLADKGKEVLNREKSKVQGVVNDLESAPEWTK
jgi:YtxH-like protein